MRYHQHTLQEGISAQYDWADGSKHVATHAPSSVVDQVVAGGYPHRLVPPMSPLFQKQASDGATLPNACAIAQEKTGSGGPGPRGKVVLKALAGVHNCLRLCV